MEWGLKALKTTIVDILLITECDSSNTLAYYTRGHVDKQIFVDSVLDYTGVSVSIEGVSHTFLRKVPSKEYGNLLIPCKVGRGAFPVTYYNI